MAVSAASLPAVSSAQSAAKPAVRAPRVDDPNAPTTLGAERMTGRPDREVFLERDAEIIRGGTIMNSDRATYDVVDDRVDANGNVRIKRFGDRYTGDELQMKMDTGQGYVTNPTYRLEQNNAQGKAERVDFLSNERALVHEGTYSTCEGPDPSWYIQSSKLNLDTGLNLGAATKAIVYFKGVPILASPYMTFPLSAERKSGFLPPTFGTTNKGGLEILTPYYFNIAPNRDVTMYPKIISQRGIQMGALGRYLGSGYQGQTRVEGMLNDRLANRNRFAISSVHSQSFGNGFSMSSDINGASDDDYPNDFPTTITTASQRLLLRDLSLSYGRQYWSATARSSSYQVLQDPAAPIARPYDRLPQLTLAGARANLNGFDYSLASEFTRFYHPDLVRGERLVVNPRVSYPFLHPAYFVRPSVSVHATTYNLSNQTAGVPQKFTRVLPTVSVDSGLVFERETTFLGREAIQTLEPRLFYVYTPYKDQSLFPNFDTGLADFNFSQIFTENRYSGNDRISDANQLTTALVSRFIESTGAERMRFALAQRYYFNDQRVVGATAETKSDLLAAAGGRISDKLVVDAGVQWSQSQRTLSRTNLSVTYAPGPKKVLNAQYRRDLLGNIDLYDVSGQWPIADRWYAVGRVNYSRQEKKIAEGLFGLEYKADCWVFRVVGQRLPTSSTVATSALFFQLELNGLAKFGSNPLEAIRTNVPGYQLINQP